MSDWQPIETAPKDGTEVLLFVPGYIGGRRVMEGNIVVGAWIDDHAWGREGVWWSDISDPYEGHSGATADSVDLTPTHWMPLPEAPK